MTSAFFWQNSISLCPASFRIPTLCDHIDGSLPGSAIPGILQARTLEWVAIAFSGKSKYSSFYIFT